MLNMTGHQKFFGKVTTVTAVLNLLLNMFLIPMYGMLGAAMATGFSILLTNSIAIIYIHKKLKVLSVYLPFLSDKIDPL
ncbi:MAG: polysaccharide biosynthesis C-terminal domain-containing protein [Bacteroidales bacterium]|nr:polysaccharide biosynthesis C-terminal domain-containing protein [Bacteroidales bacterium]